MRVVAGTARGRRLTAPEGRDVRPTTDRVREAVFNSLGSLDVLAGARVLDLFAGTGALGIEALSRGAGSATFVERDRTARAAVEANVATTGLEGDATVVADDAERFLIRSAGAAGAGVRFDLVLLDPPYAFGDWAGLLAALEPLVAPGGVVVIESDHPLEAPTWAEMVRTKSYGSTVVSVLRRTSSPDSEPPL